MPIDFQCACGKTLKAPDGSEGRKARCPKCSNVVVVPSALAAVESNPPTSAGEYDLNEPVAAPARSVAPPPISKPISTATLESRYPTPQIITSGSRPVRSFMYLLLLLTLIPLVWITFQKHETGEEKFAHTVAAHAKDPEVINKLFDENGNPKFQSDQELFDALPGNRLDGALFSHETSGHWLIAILAAAAFFSFFMLAFPGSHRFTKGLLFAGIFTGTAGILLLLGFQWAAFSMPMVIPRGVIGLVLLIVKLIGLSYRLAEGDTGFFLSFLGFTCGVGLCEEATKALPLLFRIRPIPGEEDPSWYNLLLWGLASGTGFGIAEGIMYSHHYYNGIEPASMYVVRFVSCVALHAMWAGATGINIYRKQGALLNAANNWEYCFNVVFIILIPMVLHGLYDTLLKQEYNAFALVVAVASFGWLVFQIERAYRSEPALPASASAFPVV